MTSEACVENFYGKVFGILIWDIVIRNRKFTFYENTNQKILLSLSQKLQNFISLDYVGDNVGKGYDCLGRVA